MTDEEAIVAEGMTLAAFPPLEYLFDIVVNDFMPNPLGTMVGEVTLPITSTSALAVIAKITQTWDFTISQDSHISAVATLSHSKTFDFTSQGAAKALATLAQDDLFEINSTATAAAIVTLNHNYVLPLISVAYSGRAIVLRGVNVLEIESHAELKIGQPVIEPNLPVWPFEPNWASTLSETLEWLTDIMTSPSGSEQRRSLRPMPRRTFEYTMIAVGEERGLFDNMLMTYSARKVYLPLWHDVNFLEEPIAVRGTFIKCDSAPDSKILPNSAAVLIGDSVYDNELVEIEDVAADGFYLAAGVKRSWPIDTRIYPAQSARFTDQPEATKATDNVVTSGIRFQILQPDRTPILPVIADTYGDFIVLTDPPDERTPLNASLERMLVELDNQTSIPRWRDTADRPFTYEQYAWVLEGRDELAWFENLLLTLRGRSQPLWVPTFMEDMVLAAPVTAGAETMLVERCGFTVSGGPRPEREHIMIETTEGRIYRRIAVSAFNVRGQEVIAFDTPLDTSFTPDDVVRICFMNLMRLNQDNVIIDHQTDSDGVATALAIFRSAPDTRIPEPAPF